MARATNDLNAVRNAARPAIMYSANTMSSPLALWLSCSPFSPKLTIYAFLPLPIASIVIQYSGAAIHERFERIRQCSLTFSARAQETSRARELSAPM